MDRWFDPAADKTIKKMDTASGLPNASGRFVTRMKIGPRCFNLCSFAASLADVELAGYSPPVPKPVMPRATVSIQNIPMIDVPWLAVPRIPPSTIIAVVITIAALRPM